MSVKDSSPCPSPEDLDGFATGLGLDPASRAALEGHFADCAICASLVAALIASEFPEAPARLEHDDELEAAGPRYKLLRLLGSGGMGAVYEAEEVRSGRLVALKLAHERGGTSGAALVERFQRETRIASLLEHPNILPVFDVGVFPDGMRYFTQRLVKGRSLGVAIAACSGPAERIAMLPQFRDLCDAIAYAHRLGIVHRDLKPGNTILGPAGEAWVIDWGLARVVGSAHVEADRAGAAEKLSNPGLTAAGTTLGTPAYMSPEQARGEIDSIDERRRRRRTR